MSASEILPTPVAGSATRVARKARTRAALKSAARACFAANGYPGTQIGDIARAADVAQGTLYVHFPSKEAILDELLAELDRELVERLEAAWAGDGRSPRPEVLEDRVRAVAMACLATWHSNRELLRAFAERASLGVDVRRLHQGVSPSAATWLRVLLDRAAETLGAPIPHPELVASALLGLWMRVGLASLLDPTPAHAELAELLTRLSLGAIGGVIGGAIAPHEMGPPAATSARRRTRRRTTTR